jgi:anti-sigma B factor antagonist
MALEIAEVNKVDDIWKISIVGEMDINSYLIVKEKLDEVLEDEIIDIELNCENLSYIDSTGIGVLIGVLKRMKKNEKQISIINAKNNIKRLFNITGLDKIFVVK